MRKAAIFSGLSFLLFVYWVSSLPFGRAHQVRHLRPHHLGRHRYVSNDVDVEDDNDVNSGDGFLNALSFSFVGNLDLPQSVESISKIADGISDFISMEMVEALVEVVVDNVLMKNVAHQLRIHPLDGGVPSSRIDYVRREESAEERRKRRLLKDELVTVFGAALDKEQCWEKACCFAGWRSRWFAAKDIVFVLVEQFFPSMKETVSLVREGAEGDDAFAKCMEYRCNEEEEEVAEEPADGSGRQYPDPK